MKWMKVALGALIAAGAMMLAANSALANPGDVITVSPGGSITATSNGRLTLTSPLLTITCDVAFSGTINSGPITQVSNRDAVGSVSSASVTNCSGGNVAIVLISSPWTIYGVLPLPSDGGANLQIGTPAGLGIEVRNPLGVSCLYGNTIGAGPGSTDVQLEPAGDVVTFTRAPTPRVSGNAFLCGNQATLTGTMALSPAQTVALS